MSEFEQRQSLTHSSHLVSPARPEWAKPRPEYVGNPVSDQQQVMGNQAAQQFAQACPLKLPSPAICPYGGVCHTCPARVQAKLTINKPGDKYEQEADRVADQVMRMPEPRMHCACPTCDDEETLRTKPLVAQITPLVQRQVELEEEAEEEGIPTQLAYGAQVQRQEEEPEEEEEEPIRAKQNVGPTSRASPLLEAQIHSLRGGGQPLPPSVRNFFEPRFGCDFDLVRIHTDERATKAAGTVNAQAFTVGRDIVLGKGQYAPETVQGRRLLAHELTHLVQKGIARTENSKAWSDRRIIQRAAPVAAGAAAVSIGAVAAKCILGAIIGALFDAAIQAALHAWRKWTWRFWRVKPNYCSIILSAIIGCIAAPVAAYALKPWITAQLGTRLGGIAGTLTGKILLFIANKLSMAIPKGIVSKLAKLGCISPEQAAELGVMQ